MGRSSGPDASKAQLEAVIEEADVRAWRELTVANPKSEPTPEEKDALRAKKEAEKKGKAKLVDSIAAKVTKATTVIIKKDKIKKTLDALAQAQREADEAVAARPPWLDPPSGTRDFYPKEMRLRNWLFGEMRAVALAYAFKEYDAPVLEHVELYERKAGEEITQQMYDFVDKEKTRVTLRPEMTPSLARMVLNLTNLATGEVRTPLPLKWFSIPQCWRFEATQRGRKREHYQWNMDIVGEWSVTAEVELLGAICAFFAKLGVGPDVVGVRVNSRKVLDAVVAAAGVPRSKFAQVCVVVDKIDKIGGSAVKEMLCAEPLQLPDSAADSILQCLAAKTVDDVRAILMKHDGVASGDANTATRDQALTEMQDVFDLAEAAGFGAYLDFDASVVRGLAYYTGVVFEAFDRRGELRAICGGGRYDRLLELYGGDKCTIPCCGFGFGDCVIVELLKDLGKLPELPAGVDVVVAPFSEADVPHAFRVASTLRAAGFAVDLALEARKARQAFDLANRAGARRVAFVAPDEWAQGLVRVKDMLLKDPETGEGLQLDVPLASLPDLDRLFADEAVSKKVPGAASPPPPPPSKTTTTTNGGAGPPPAPLTSSDDGAWQLQPTAKFAVLGPSASTS